MRMRPSQCVSVPSPLPPFQRPWPSDLTGPRRAVAPEEEEEEEGRRIFWKSAGRRVQRAAQSRGPASPPMARRRGVFEGLIGRGRAPQTVDSLEGWTSVQQKDVGIGTKW